MVVDTQYPLFIRGLYASNPGMAQRHFDSQRQALLDAAFGSSDHYSRPLRAFGHEAQDVIVNAMPAQRRWAREAGHQALSRRPVSRAWAGRILEAQIRELRPDVVWLLDMSYPTEATIRRLRPHVSLLVGQVACPFDFTRDLSGYDLVVSSLPHFVRRFRRLGVRSEFLPLGFEPSLRARVDTQGERDVEVAFVGSAGNAHSVGTALLNAAAGELPLSFWGPKQCELPEPLATRYKGTAWGLEMYAVLARSQVALNRHIDIAADYANNLRMFEATGMGACLLTDDKRNIAELFVPGEEVVTYTDAEDCIRKANELRSDPAMRAAIAEAGLRRTLRDHTYEKRVEALLAMLPEAGGRRPQPTSRAHRTWRAPGRVRAARERLAAVRDRRVSRDFRLVDSLESSRSLGDAWKDPSIAPRQRALVGRQLHRMYEGSAPIEFTVAAAAVDATRLDPVRIAEIGCSSGYYGEVLTFLASSEIDYTGVDYSLALLRSGRARSEQLPLTAGDATRLPFRSESFDVVLSAAVLMHVPDWRTALEESLRISRRYVVLHRTPVAELPRTVHMEKLAYGVRVVEHVFARGELDAAITESGGEIVGSWPLARARHEPVDDDVEVVTLLLRRGDR
jgi:SAM-dependent methyltransferase